jgi:hypothetical protein
MKIEQTDCSETLAVKFHTPENNPKENKRRASDILDSEIRIARKKS